MSIMSLWFNLLVLSYLKMASFTLTFSNVLSKDGHYWLLKSKWQTSHKESHNMTKTYKDNETTKYKEEKIN